MDPRWDQDTCKVHQDSVMEVSLVVLTTSPHQVTVPHSQASLTSRLQGFHRDLTCRHHQWLAQWRKFTFYVLYMWFEVCVGVKVR